MITTSIIYPGSAPEVNDYVGANLASTTLSYQWTEPSGAGVDEWRIRRRVGSGWASLAPSIPAAQTSYVWNSVPASLQGQSIQTQIQYRSGLGPWTGDFYDKTHASFREPGQPLKYYGIRIQDFNQLEPSENPLFGAPEIRLAASQGLANGETELLQETLIPMEACTQGTPVRVEVPYYPYQIFVVLNTNTGFYYPAGSPNGFVILASWDSSLPGTLIRVRTEESDIAVARISGPTAFLTETKDMTARIGIKELESDPTGNGFRSTSEEGSEEKVIFPEADKFINNTIIEYHFPQAVVVGQPGLAQELYGVIDVTNACVNLVDKL